MEPTALTATAIIGRYLQAFDAICTEENKTAGEVAASINVSGAIISQLRSGFVKTLRADYVANLCTLYGYSMIWVLTGEGERRSDNETATLQAEIAKIKKDLAKVLELQKDVIGPLINEILGIKIEPGDVTRKLIGEVKKHTKLNN